METSVILLLDLGNGKDHFKVSQRTQILSTREQVPSGVPCMSEN